MILTRVLAHRGMWRRIAAAALMVCVVSGAAGFKGAVPPPAWAADHAYVLPDGRKVPLTRSNTELAVTIKKDQDAEALARRLRGTDGTLEPFLNAPRSPVRLLRVDKADAQRLGKLRQDPGIAEVRPVYRFATSPVPVASSGEIVLRLQPGLSDEDRAALWREYQVGIATPEFGLPGVYRLGAFDADFDEVDLAARLAEDARTVWAQPNFRRSKEQRQVVPSDPFYSLQWHLNNTGQLGGVFGADIDAPEAWQVTLGEGVIFGMFDDSCDVDHEDLAANYIGIGHDPSLAATNPGFQNPRPKRVEDSHGTAVMGLAVAAANNFGGRGVAPAAKFTASRGLTEFLTDSQTASVVTFARQQNVDVHINSWGFVGPQPNPQVLVDSIRIAFEQGRNRGDVNGDGSDDVFGMVIVFSAGNEGQQNVPGFGVSTIPQVISVGASNNFDQRASFSNFGITLAIMAPGEGSPSGIMTTDNTDGEYPEDGYNVGGTNLGLGVADVDAAGKYTRYFGGTSAACPIVAGVAGLILSVNPNLTANDVRLILEHTSDPISPGTANYHGITSRSLQYGYGRVNAGGAGAKVGAVEAAQQSLDNGGRSWPDRAAELQVDALQIRWKQGYGTDEYLIVESNSSFSFVPEDGDCYSEPQFGCAGETISPLPAGVTVLAIGCQLACGGAVAQSCATGSDRCVDFLQPDGTKFFGIYGRSDIGRYSWGVAADSTGAVVDPGVLVGGAGGGFGGDGDGGGNGGVGEGMGPSVTISVSPLRGKSPLVVNFAGNAVSEDPIDESKTSWDFDISDETLTNAQTRNATFTYVVGPGVVRTFVARFTMFDTAGRSGLAEVTITVEGDVISGGNGPGEDGDLRIIVGLPGTPGSNVDGGRAPFSTLLSIDSSGLPGVLQSVSWDLGDGTQASTLVVPHTYQNPNDEDIRIPITATVTSVTPGGVATTTVTRFITIQPGQATAPTPPPTLPGTGAEGLGGRALPCGVVGIVPLVFCFLSLVAIRRRST